MQTANARSIAYDMAFSVSHFSGVGVGSGTPANVAAVAAAAGLSVVAHYLNLKKLLEDQLAVQFCGAPSCVFAAADQIALWQNSVQAAYPSLFRPWFETGLRPLLSQSSANDPALSLAAREFFEWLAYVDGSSLDETAPFPDLIHEGTLALAQGYFAALTRASSACDDIRIGQLAGEIEVSVLLAGAGPLPARISEIGDRFGCRLKIELSTLPMPINLGQTATLTVKL